jgi:hypothetical protein
LQAESSPSNFVKAVSFAERLTASASLNKAKGRLCDGLFTEKEEFATALEV